MLKVIKTKNWKLYWGMTPLPEGAKALGLVTLENGPTGALLRLADGRYAQGNTGELRLLPKPAVQQALASAKAVAQAKRKPSSGHKPLRP